MGNGDGEWGMGMDGGQLAGASKCCAVPRESDSLKYWTPPSRSPFLCPFLCP
jgi:hypothetical protein